MINYCPKCKQELRHEKTVDYISVNNLKTKYVHIDLYYCLHCRAGYTKIINEYPIKGIIK